ncbi:MAG: transcription repressor NadR [Clostridiales bacterium]|nr:transcription repressor NadR [Clostridiales bacterium]
MNSKDRKKEIAALLASQKRAITGDFLSEKYGVSRQIIVQDIAYLRKLGYTIVSTHYGYLLKKSPLLERVFEVYHDKNSTEDELLTIVQCGGTAADVFIMHDVYGKISAPLNILTEKQVGKFIETVKSGTSAELMNITGGRHFHTVRAENKVVLDNIEKALKEKGYLVEK